MSLTVKDLKKVYRETFNASGKWRNVLLELGLEVSAIDSIGSKWGDKPDECYREGLSIWLKGGERSWRDLMEALCSPTVGHKDIAEGIAKEYIVEQATPRAPSDACRQPITGELIIFTNEQLGNGAFGAVFKGSFRGTPCAVKLLHHVAMQIKINLLAGQAAEEAVKTFDRECEFLKSFQHPNIVQHLSTEKHPTSGNTILVIELMDCNLRGYFSSLSEESLSSDCQLSLSRDVASGLAYIHSKHIIHRDLCGDNILLKLAQPVPVAKISDFGMSRLLDSSQVSSTLTAMGCRMGYLPPEAPRLEEEQYDYSLDVFSLGVIMVQIALKLETVKSPRDRAEYVGLITDTCTYVETSHLQVLTRGHEEEAICKSNDELSQGTRADTADENLTIRLQSPYQQPPSRLRIPSSITFDWERLQDAPHFMRDPPVALNGKLYARGFSSQRIDTVHEYTPGDYEWKELPEPPDVHDFTVATVNDQLLVVGGKVRSAKRTTYTNSIFTFDEQSQKWVHFFRALPEELTNPVVIGYRGHLIVGAGGRYNTDVNILNTSTKKWIRVKPLPWAANYRAVIVGDTVYLVTRETKHVIRAHVPTLISGASESEVWESLPDTPLFDSTLIAINNTLLAVEGRNYLYKNNRASGIYMYDPTKNEWTKVGDLKKPMYDCLCTVLSRELFVLGGLDSSGINYVYVAKLRVMY